MFKPYDDETEPEPLNTDNDDIHIPPEEFEGSVADYVHDCIKGNHPWYKPIRIYTREGWVFKRKCRVCPSVEIVG